MSDLCKHNFEFFQSPSLWLATERVICFCFSIIYWRHSFVHDIVEWYNIELVPTRSRCAFNNALLLSLLGYSW